MTLYPLAQILLYLALFFAPPDATQVAITGPDFSIKLTRGETGWTSGAVTFIAAAGQLIRGENLKKETTSVADHVKSALGHDWAVAPKLNLDDATTLEKTADGYLLRVNDGDPAVRVYAITYHRPAPAAVNPAATAPGEMLIVNVLGTVVKPGAYTLHPGAMLLDALAAAGGAASTANTKKISIVRGPAGEKPSVFIHDADAILRGQASNPPLFDHDTLLVPERIF